MSFLRNMRATIKSCLKQYLRDGNNQDTCAFDQTHLIVRVHQLIGLENKFVAIIENIQFTTKKIISPDLL